MSVLDDIKDYLSFDDHDAARLRELHPHLAPHFPHITRQFYDALERNDATRLLFSDTETLHASFGEWLQRLLLGPYDHGYFEQRRRIGLVHVRIGLRPHFVFGAMNVVRRSLLSAILDLDELRSAEHLGSVEKVIDLDTTIIMQTYWEQLMRNKLQVPAALAAGLAHEIRNPLNAIGLHLTLLERRLRRVGDESEAASSSIEGIRTELRRMRALTSEIVDFAKPLEPSPVWIDPHELLEHLEANHKAPLIASGISLDLEVRGAGRVWADRDLLRNALVSLVTNAVEALDGTGAIRVTIALEPAWVVIHVQDSGAGIPEDVAAQAFDLFFTTKASGTGLGLPSVQKIVEAHSGSVEIEQPPTGASICLRIPQPPQPA